MVQHLLLPQSGTKGEKGEVLIFLAEQCYNPPECEAVDSWLAIRRMFPILLSSMSSSFYSPFLGKYGQKQYLSLA